MDGTVLYKIDTPYQRLVVAVDADGSKRYLYSGNKDEKQGGIYLKNPLKLFFEYTKVSLVSLAFLGREPRDMLFVGLGSGSLPGYMGRHYPSARIDVAEIDREVLDVARRFFYFDETDNLKVHIADGRNFLRKTSRAYDMIFLDAYQTGEIPYHLSTVEFLDEVKARLREGGVVVSNIVAEEKNSAYPSMEATYVSVFPKLYVFEGISSYNNVLIATTNPVQKRTFLGRARRIQKEKKMNVRLHRLASRPFYRPRARTGAEVLADILNPNIEILSKY